MAHDPDDPIWQPRGQPFWDDIGKKAALRKGSLALRFVAAKEMGCSNAEAARRAGAGGSANTSGYRLSKSNEVLRLYATLQAETGSELGNVDAKRARSILSRLAEGSDPSIRIRAIEALQKMDEREAFQRRDELGDGSETLRQMIRCAGAVGALAACATYFREFRTLYGMPLAREVLPLVRARYPEAWREIIESIPPSFEHHKEDIFKLSAGPVLRPEEIAPADKPAANGHSENGAEAKANGGELSNAAA